MALAFGGMAVFHRRRSRLPRRRHPRPDHGNRHAPPPSPARGAAVHGVTTDQLRGENDKRRRSVSRVLSRIVIHLGLPSPTSSSDLPERQADRLNTRPIWSCFRWGLPRHRSYLRRGALLPHHFTLTPLTRGGIVSVALSIGSRRPDVIWHRVL